MKPYTSDRIKIPPGLWEGIHQLGISADDVARKAQLPLTIITEPTVTTAQYFAIWQAYSDLMGTLPKASSSLRPSLKRRSTRRPS